MTELTLSRPAILPPRGLLIALVAQLPLIATTPLTPGAVEVVVGVTIAAAAVFLMVWAERLFQWNGVGVCPFSRVPMLIEHGPYRFTRNPMYLGLIGVDAGVVVATGILPNLWSVVALFIWLHYAYVLPEEEFLRREIGPAFDAYAKRVPRWLAA
jgi:protein-S-isoprenylcysteine O-methyltransferase Ste14